jgi:hypothetical protein
LDLRHHRGLTGITVEVSTGLTGRSGLTGHDIAQGAEIRSAVSFAFVVNNKATLSLHAHLHLRDVVSG